MPRGAHSAEAIREVARHLNTYARQIMQGDFGDWLLALCVDATGRLADLDDYAILWQGPQCPVPREYLHITERVIARARRAKASHVALVMRHGDHAWDRYLGNVGGNLRRLKAEAEAAGLRFWDLIITDEAELREQPYSVKELGLGGPLAVLSCVRSTPNLISVLQFLTATSILLVSIG